MTAEQIITAYELAGRRGVGRTHWPGCETEHIECALVLVLALKLIQRLRARLAGEVE